MCLDHNKPLKRRIKLHNTLALPVLLYGSETLTIKASDDRRITAAEMKFTRRTVGYTSEDYKNNTNFGKIAGIQEKLDTTCKQNASK